MFRLDRGTEKLIVSLYVDDCLCATNSEKLYDEFVKDPSSKYTLSAKGKLKWYLGVAIYHDVKAGVSTMSQLEQYIETLLDRFNVTDCTRAPTPSDPNSRLLRSH
eukprot:3773948-Rhodomonas_salina.1